MGVEEGGVGESKKGEVEEDSKERKMEDSMRKKEKGGGYKFELQMLNTFCYTDIYRNEFNVSWKLKQKDNI